MTKQQQIEKLNSERNNIKSRLKIIEQELIELDNMQEKDLSFMIREYEDKKSTVIKSSIVTEKYTRILGGDGRSAPWDERVYGSVLNINFKNIWLDGDVLKRFVAYLKSVEQVDAIKINGVEI